MYYFKVLAILIISTFLSSCNFLGGKSTEAVTVKIEDLEGLGVAQSWSGLDCMFATMTDKWLMVGTPLDSAGRVVVYEVDGRELHPRYSLAPRDGKPGDHFGYGACISGDELLIGAMYDSSETQRNVGSVYQFPLKSGRDHQIVRLNGPASRGKDWNGFFGRRIVSLPENFSGTHAIAAYGEVLQRGAVYYLDDYQQPEEAWRSNVNYDQLGWGLAADEQNVYISWRSYDLGGPNTNTGLIVADNNTQAVDLLMPDTLVGMRMGLELYADNNYVVASGVPEAKDSSKVKFPGGMVSVWKKHSPTEFEWERYIFEKNGRTGDQFGHAVALIGTRLLVGIPGKSEVKVYDVITGKLTLTLEGPENSNFGYTVVANKNLIVIGDLEGGKIYYIPTSFLS